MAHLSLLVGLAFLLRAEGSTEPTQSGDEASRHDYKEDVEHAAEGAKDYKAFSDAYEKYQDFHKYVKQNASFDKFMKDYSQYMDYQKYMNQGEKRQVSASSDFQDFLDFEKYLSKGGRQAPESYQRYMDFKKYMGQGGNSPTDYKQFTESYKRYMDVSTFMKVSADSSTPVNFASDGSMKKQEAEAEESSDSKKGTMTGFMDFGHFIPGSQGQGGSGSMGGMGGGAGDYQKYMDYSKYMGISSQYTNKDWMNQWQKFQQQGQSGASVPYSATDCKTEEELKAWHDKQVSTAKEWIPTQFQAPTLDSIEKEYKSNLERIRHPEDTPAAGADPAGVDATAAGSPSPAWAASLQTAAAPVQMAAQPSQAQAEPDYLFSAEKCQTKAQLDAWRQKQLSTLNSYVPKAYQSYSKGSIDAQYDKQLKLIQAEKARPQEVAKPATPSMQKVRDQARSATSVGELVAWRAEMGFMADQMPAKEKAAWTEMLNQEMEAGLAKLEARPQEEKRSPQASLSSQPTLLAAKGPERSRTTEFSRTVLVFVISFCVPVAGLHVYRGLKMASRQSTEFDAHFMSLEGEA